MADVRHMTAATAAVTLAYLFTEWLHSSYAQWFLEGLKFGEIFWKIFVQKPANL